MRRHEISLRRIDPDALHTVKTLTKQGHEAYLVGGCVRDLLLSHPPKDFDVATSATPQQVRSLFRRCHLVGRRFRLAHVIYGNKIIQVATFRKSPRPGDVEEREDLLITHDNVYGTAQEDAYRRDFPINALFFDVNTGEVIDYVGGKDDLQQRLLRTIGDPTVRFQEDPIRILRAIRFSARLAFEIHDDTYEALLQHQSDLPRSAPARLLEEMYRVFRCGAAAEALILMRETGVLRTLLPSLDRFLQKHPTHLEPYWHAIDAWIQEGRTVENTTLLCLLAAPELEPLFDHKYARQLRNADSLIKSSLQHLSERLPVYQKEGLILRDTLLGHGSRNKARTRTSEIHELFQKVQGNQAPDTEEE